MNDHTTEASSGPTRATRTAPPIEGADRIDVAVPLRAEFASTLRTLAASLGADAGFSVDEIDDFRLGLSEVFAVLADEAVDRETPTHLSVSFFVRRGDLAVAVTTGHRVELDELAASILQSVLDQFEIAPDRITLHKRATEAAGPVDTAHA